MGKVKTIIVPVLLCLVCMGLSAHARADLINLEITVRERVIDNDTTYSLIEKRQLQIREGIKTTAFMVNFTLDITAVYNDTGFFECNFSLFTLGPQTQTFFKKFRSNPGGVYFLENVKGKKNTVYRIGISPLSVEQTASASVCRFDYREDGIWEFDPAAHFELYFVPKSLGDARWNLIREFIEKNYRNFKDAFQIDFPGKINYFLAPCNLPEVNWDPRMGYAIDPPRSNCFVIYSHDVNTVDPIPAQLVRIYRYLGYAPPMLAEGMAAYFDFPHFYARKLQETAELPDLDAMVKSVDYYDLPDLNNITAASSFVKYLLDIYGYARFADLYGRATDVSLPDDVFAVYEKSLDELETEWRDMLDTISFSFELVQYYYDRDRYIYRWSSMEMFLTTMHEKADSYSDSTFVFYEDGWNRYMRGEYQTARERFETVLGLEPSKPLHLVIFGNLLLIDGRYDSARTMYHRMLAIDSTALAGLYKLGESYYWQDNTDSAMYYLRQNLSEDQSQLTRSSSALLLGEFALRQGDTAAAAEYYTQARSFMEQIYASGRTNPSYLLRLGQADLGLALCGEETLTSARGFLESAQFFEIYPRRVIFITRILRELGRVADLMGRRDTALEYYQQALTYPLPPAFEEQVREYIREPFTGF